MNDAPAARALLSVLIAVHLLVIGTSALCEVGLTALDPLRDLTRPWEQALGVHQNWPMFVEPARNTGWLQVVGERADGSERDFPELGAEPVAGHRTYDRVGKLTRSAISSKREFLRTALVRWGCRTAAAEGDPLVRVRIERWSRETPAPGRFTDEPRAAWPTRSRSEAWNCPR